MCVQFVNPDLVLKKLILTGQYPRNPVAAVEDVLAEYGNPGCSSQ
jgi:hypothetical protein